MKIKNELRTAFQLLGLLCLLFWSFTWNIPKDFDLSKSKSSFKSATENCLKDAIITKGTNKQSLIPESFKAGKYLVDNTGFLLPPFNAWKEVELSKQEEKVVSSRIPVPKVPRRKLNYASAKCGAKILASNRESKHLLSILNEKVDEYMLNPCGIKVWFIVELCDTIEVSQIELANYELYSSMTKDFSIFWSNVYPTQTWHPLGTFQAKNQRTMQTFNIDLQNLGKFIKVIISSHHGREHFCPLSVFRVVGYSMVYEYEDIEEQKVQEKTKRNPKMNGTEPVLSEQTVSSTKGYSSIKQITFVAKPPSDLKGDVLPTELCQMMEKFCASSQLKNACRKQPACEFLETVVLEKEFLHDICTKELSNGASMKPTNNKTNTRYGSYTEDIFKNNSHEIDNLKQQSQTSKNLHNSSTHSKNLYKDLKDIFSNEVNRSLKQQYFGGNSSQIIDIKNTTDGSLFPPSTNVSQTSGRFSEKFPLEKEEISHFDHRCDCSKATNVVELMNLKQNSSSEATQFEQDFADSAALIQKESVLVKMNARIKTLETNLSLISRYLQRLSESYRMQVEDMLSVFDGTVKAITITSTKAAIVDKQHQLNVDQLDRRVNILSMKIKDLSNGQKSILKQVLELHGFFLILEIIIMSTIFSVFFNKFKRDVLA